MLIISFHSYHFTALCNMYKNSNCKQIYKCTFLFISIIEITGVLNGISMRYL